MKIILNQIKEKNYNTNNTLDCPHIEMTLIQNSSQLFLKLFRFHFNVCTLYNFNV